jgi:hypothetical protein
MARIKCHDAHQCLAVSLTRGKCVISAHYNHGNKGGKRDSVLLLVALWSKTHKYIKQSLLTL